MELYKVPSEELGKLHELLLAAHSTRLAQHVIFTVVLTRRQHELLTEAIHEVYAKAWREGR
jgi:hypothetical protein